MVALSTNVKGIKWGGEKQRKLKDGVGTRITGARRAAGKSPLETRRWFLFVSEPSAGSGWRPQGCCEDAVACGICSWQHWARWSQILGAGEGYGVGCSARDRSRFLLFSVFFSPLQNIVRFLSCVRTHLNAICWLIMRSGRLIVKHWKSHTFLGWHDQYVEGSANCNYLCTL